MPDIDRIVNDVKNWNHFQTDGHAPWIGLIYGGQTDSYDYHKTGFNFCWLRHLMAGVGYGEIAEYPHEPHFIPGFKDGSLAQVFCRVPLAQRSRLEAALIGRLPFGCGTFRRCQ